MDLIEEVHLPSNGFLYSPEVKYTSRLRAPRLCDKGIGDLTRKYKLQASILDKTLLDPIGISAYDLHIADFLYLNLAQRQISKGNKPYKIEVFCPKCKHKNIIDFDLSKLKITRLTSKPNYEYTTIDGQQLSLGFLTPRILDDSEEKANDFKEEYPDSDGDIRTQELLRALIKEVDGQKPTYSQMTNVIDNLFIEDVNEIMMISMKSDFGIDLSQTTKCESCNKKIKYDLPV